jgi:hypothetical protein
LTEKRLERFNLSGTNRHLGPAFNELLRHLPNISLTDFFEHGRAVLEVGGDCFHLVR